jgi:hypothetical protein
MTIKELLLKRKDVQTVTGRVVVLSAMVVYTKVTEKSLTTSASTELVVSKTFQLVLLAVQQIASGSLPGIK